MSIRKWIRRAFGGDGDDDGSSRSRPQAHWLEPDDPGNPFGVRLLDLMSNLQMLSTTQDPALAARAVSWKPGMQRDVEVDIEGETRRCALRYPAARELPDGMLYRPEQMEDKWVIALRDGRLAIARSWTGDTKAVAAARHVGDALELDSVTFTEGSGFEALGDPVAAFDWVIRSHALGARIPFPASAEGADVLSKAPLAGFSIHGRQLFCAAVDYEPGSPSGCLFSDGDLAAAVCSGDAEGVREALAAGAPVNAPTRFSDGAPVLHLALMLHPELVELLLDAGADVNAATRRGSTPLMAAASSGAERAVLDRLLSAGAEQTATDEAGFTAAHVAAQFGRVNVLEALVDHDASLSAATKGGLTPLHVAAGLGNVEVVEWIVGRGVDPRTPSPLGDPLAIAEKEGHDALARFLRGLAGR